MSSFVDGGNSWKGVFHFSPRAIMKRLRQNKLPTLSRFRWKNKSFWSAWRMFQPQRLFPPFTSLSDNVSEFDASFVPLLIVWLMYAVLEYFAPPTAHDWVIFTDFWSDWAWNLSSYKWKMRKFAELQYPPRSILWIFQQAPLLPRKHCFKVFVPTEEKLLRNSQLDVVFDIC